MGRFLLGIIISTVLTLHHLIIRCSVLVLHGRLISLPITPPSLIHRLLLFWALLTSITVVGFKCMVWENLWWKWLLLRRRRQGRREWRGRDGSIITTAIKTTINTSSSTISPPTPTAPTLHRRRIPVTGSCGLPLRRRPHRLLRRWYLQMHHLSVQIPCNHSSVSSLQGVWWFLQFFPFVVLE